MQTHRFVSSFWYDCTTITEVMTLLLTLSLLSSYNRICMRILFSNGINVCDQMVKAQCVESCEVYSRGFESLSSEPLSKPTANSAVHPSGVGE